MTLLAVVPARAGSKGIPGKALRTVGGVPLILRTLRAVDAASIADRLRVSTDCPQIKSFCELRGYSVIDRPAALADDGVPLAPVAAHAAEVEQWDGDVALFQSTCPLVRPSTLAEVTRQWQRAGADWGITVAADDHAYWRDGQQVTARAVNRQYRKPLLRESGAAQFFSPAHLAGDEADKRELFTITAREALDVDTPDDLLVAEALARQARIHFVVAMGSTVGTGHFHRAQTLARALSHHHLSWEWRGDPPDWALRRVEHFHHDSPADLTIFDCLTPTDDELIEARRSGLVVVLEDETSESRRYADLLVNAMLSTEDLRYEPLREEFLCLPPRRHREIPEHLLITFGGTDPAGLAHRCSEALDGIDCDIEVLPQSAAVSMAHEMRGADLVLTGQGRTVMEAAVSSTPCISIAANEREARHVHIPGVTYLGLHSTVTDELIRQAVTSTLASRQLREEKATTARAALDERGLDRLVRRIEELLL